MDKSIEEMTGEKTAQPLVKFDQITLHGREGKMFLTFNASKEKGEDGFYPREELTQPVPLTFLVRRARLVKPSADGIKMYSDEYEDKNEVVSVYEQGNKVETAPAYILKDKYDLKGEAIVYARYKGEVVRLRMKGLSIQPHDDRNDFYSYIFSFDKEKGENFWKYVTEISTEECETKNGKFFRMKFARKRPLTPDEIEAVKVQIHDTYTKITRHKQAKREEPAVDISSPDTPETEEISPDDIPF